MEERLLGVDYKRNTFLIDWLTFVVHGATVEDCKYLLGMNSDKIPWTTERKFRNGYPMQTYFDGITISWGADSKEFFSDPQAARSDMGICVNLSGKGCRYFESHGSGNWFLLFDSIFCDHLSFRFNVTRLDLAYDDHSGILDIHQIEEDTRARNYVSRSKYSEIIWSDDQELNIQGCTVNIGSPASDTKIRIYDKAAERGFKDKHWVRVEIQLRRSNAFVALGELQKRAYIGTVCAGILGNYLTFRQPSEDSNKSRWPVADYWAELLQDFERISLWITPGIDYNFASTEYWLRRQYGPAISVLAAIGGTDDLVKLCKREHPLSSLPPKYKPILSEYGL